MPSQLGPSLQEFSSTIKLKKKKKKAVAHSSIVVWEIIIKMVGFLIKCGHLGNLISFTDVRDEKDVLATEWRKKFKSVCLNCGSQHTCVQ